MATLAITKGPNAGQRYDLGDLTTIGRYPFCDIRLDLTNVSRHHARVVARDTDYFIEDLNSQNGTFVNGEKVHRQRLRHNDLINIYQVSLLFIDDSSIDSDTQDVDEAADSPRPTRPRGPSILESVDATSDSQIIANAEEKWRASLSVLRGVGRSLDVDVMLEQLLDDLFRIFPHADRGYILLIEDDGALTLQALKEDGGTNVDQTLGPVDRTLAEEVIAHGEAVLCLDEEDSDSESVLDLPVRSIMCTPLISPLAKTLGVLYIDTKQDQKRFSSEDLELLVSVAAVAAQSVAFARQHQASMNEHERHARELEQEIAERKRIEEELRRSNNDLQEFAYVASHDLQEPLRAVAGFVQLLEQANAGQLDDEGRGFIQQAVMGTVRMQSLIDDLLEYSRVRTRGTEFQLTRCNEVLESALANLSASITESSAMITHDELPEIHADATQVLQLFQNLVGNAIKFRSSDRQPEIHVSAAQNNGECVFRVSDNGIGIRSNHVDRIFKMFQRLHSRDAFPGSGVGLTICRRIVERHGGRIWVESRVDEGSTFCFTIPLSANQ